MVLSNVSVSHASLLHDSRVQVYSRSPVKKSFGPRETGGQVYLALFHLGKLDPTVLGAAQLGCIVGDGAIRPVSLG